MSGSPVSPTFRQWIRGLAVPIAVALGRLGLTPNGLTVIGFLGTCGAAVAAAAQQWVLAGVLVVVFGIFDLFDGALARATGRVTRFGAFLDSTLDRTGENLVLAGIVYGSATAGFVLGAGLAALAMALASVVTYARARAEAVGLHGEVGVAPRPERLILLALGLVGGGAFGGIAAFDVQCPGGLMVQCVDRAGTPMVTTGAWFLGGALALISLLSAITIAQRILHVRNQSTEG